MPKGTGSGGDRGKVVWVQAGLSRSEDRVQRRQQQQSKPEKKPLFRLGHVPLFREKRKGDTEVRFYISDGGRVPVTTCPLCGWNWDDPIGVVDERERYGRIGDDGRITIPGFTFKVASEESGIRCVGCLTPPVVMDDVFEDREFC